MTFDNTYNRFRLISGLSDMEISKWLPILKEAMSYVESLVNKKDLSKADSIRLDNAAAVYAYYQYVSYSIEAESSFSAGDLSVTYNKERLQKAENLWKKELESINDMVTSGFIFKRVT